MALCSQALTAARSFWIPVAFSRHVHMIRAVCLRGTVCTELVHHRRQAPRRSFEKYVCAPENYVEEQKRL